MSKNKPVELGLKHLNRSDIVGKGEHRFITSEFGFVNSMHHLHTDLFRVGQPYRVKEGRIIQPLYGDARVSVNLTEYTLSPGNILLISPGSIIEALYIPSVFDLRMIAPSNDFIQFLPKNDFSSHYLSGQLNLLLKVTDEESRKIEHFFSLMWDVLQEPVFQKETTQSLLMALLYYIKYIQKKRQTTIQIPSRQEEIFQRFITLVNENCKTERNVGFYADKLCLTPRYLNTVIKQVSQQTVMDWINQAIILEAKVLLKHSNLLVYQVSDELQFATPSFFCKFFKKMTGMTPQEYQKK
ncbi:helix-turn-helix domain-containing protein [Bacteroides sp.]